VKRVVHVEVGNIHVDGIGNLTRLAANINFADDLFEHALLFLHPNRLADEVERHGDFDLLALHETSEIGVNQATLNRIDLPIVKHHFTLANAVDFDRENRVSPGFRTKDRSQITRRSNGSNSFSAASINGNGNHSLAPHASSIILAATLALFCLDPELFFLRHDFSPQALAICDCQLPIFKTTYYTLSATEKLPSGANRQLAIGNRQCP